MKNLTFIISVFFLNFGLGKAFANSSATILLEDKMDLFEKIVNLQVKLGVVQSSGFWNEDRAMNSMALVDTLWKKGWDSQKLEDQRLAAESLKKIDFNDFEIADQVRLFLLDQRLGGNLVNNSKFMNDIFETSKEGKLQRREIYTILNYKEELLESGFGEILDQVSLYNAEDLALYNEAKDSLFEVPNRSLVQDLVFFDKDPGDYGRGQYRYGPKLFMFCRKNRNYPCMMFMKDSRNQIVRNDDASIWTHKALGLARKNKPYNVKNGFTPAGVYTIDSVMPEANRQRVFGKYRRLIINFIPRTKDEERTKELLPESSFNSNWWKQAVVARDIGRNLLRIHGTGLRNNNPSSSYYPFVKTSGCIAMRENRYDGKKYKDQRILLDQLMTYSGFTPRRRNETKIRALLYVIEVDNKNKAVEKSDIEDILDLR